MTLGTRINSAFANINCNSLKRLFGSSLCGRKSHGGRHFQVCNQYGVPADRSAACCRTVRGVAAHHSYWNKRRRYPYLRTCLLYVEGARSAICYRTQLAESRETNSRDIVCCLSTTFRTLFRLSLYPVRDLSSVHTTAQLSLHLAPCLLTCSFLCIVIVIGGLKSRGLTKTPIV
jgi:hypothetical protein